MRTALYRAYDAGGSLLYVGISLCAGSRMSQHQRDAPWWLRVATIKFEWFKDREAAAKAELAAIATEHPEFNKAGVSDPINRPSPAVLLAENSPAVTMGRLLTTEQAGQFLSLSSSLLNKLRLTGDGPVFVRLAGRAIRYRQADLERWVLQSAATSTSQYLD